MNSLIDTAICKATALIPQLTEMLYNLFSSVPEIVVDKLLYADLKNYVPAKKVTTIKKIFEKELNSISKADVKAVLTAELAPHLARLKNNIYAVIESPYIDKMYRDAYYTYYSSKLKGYNRDTCRISLFDKPIHYADFRDFEDESQNPLANNYLGYIVIRPTLNQIVGRTVISPKALKNDQFVCCQTKVTSTANAIKFKVSGFPYACQDQQTITCAETTIWSLMEYFGNKFPDFKPILPSTIHQIVNRILTKRLVPSEGLYTPQMSYVLRELGFGSMIYSKRHSNDFFPAIGMYIQSGIPVIGIYRDKTGQIGHAVNIIGHERDDYTSVINFRSKHTLKTGGTLIDYHAVKRRFVVIDDNYPPYQLADLTAKNITYGSNPTGYELTDIIVPLYKKIYLDALGARQTILKTLESGNMGLKTGEVVISKTFLASTRSYRQYLAMNKTIDPFLKELLLMVPLPRFIWVSELSSRECFRNGCTGLILLDATEPIPQREEYNDKENLLYTPLTAVYNKGLLYWQNLLNFEKERIFAPNSVPVFTAYNENLKAAYTD